MSTWTDAELAAIARADELRIAPRQADGTLRTAVPIWVVRVGDDLYVRGHGGDRTPWFRAARASGTGHITSGGVDKDVSFEVAEPAVNDLVDAAYRAKYGARYSAAFVDPIVAPLARTGTVKLVPRG
jgi:hypothetical protein